MPACRARGRMRVVEAAGVCEAVGGRGRAGVTVYWCRVCILVKAAALVALALPWWGRARIPGSNGSDAPAALYGVRANNGPAAICYLGASDEMISLSSVQTECEAALRVARRHASNCISLAKAMNGSMPRPVIHLTVSDDRPLKGVKVKAGQVLVDVSLRAGTISVTWDPVCLESSYLAKTPHHLLPLITSLCTGAPAGTALATDYLSAAERQLLVTDCNKTHALVPRGCTHNFLTAAAAESPAHPAVIYGDQTW
jgi:hypothetical protein